MKRPFISLLIPLAFLASCEFEQASHGSLYGYWHLIAVDTIALDTATQSASTISSTDLREQRLFWAMEGHLVEMNDRDQQHSTLVGRFVREGDSLFVEQPYFSNRYSGDPEVTELPDLLPFGIDTVKPRLLIERLSSGDLALRSKNRRLKFKKM
jgi:hypothetical protein